ncbi:hypothetical protein [Pseudanabaena sp. PCC 6802]|uniref:hypothetical protein n=1 Tax=Pseudanabaena sp. PCC 6802 TaxID=118173 RepID=UPI0012E9AE32|nr:hypothetical protein [Pseudanabaena sp. PCC 6802]
MTRASPTGFAPAHVILPIRYHFKRSLDPKSCLVTPWHLKSACADFMRVAATFSRQAILEI